MGMVCGLDLHRGQITYDALIEETGEIWRGRIFSPDRARFRRWLEVDVAKQSNGAPVAMAVEGCTGWRYVVEEIARVRYEAHLAEPAETQAARGRKKRAKTDRSEEGCTEIGPGTASNVCQLLNRQPKRELRLLS